MTVFKVLFSAAIVVVVGAILYAAVLWYLLEPIFEVSQGL